MRKIFGLAFIFLAILLWGGTQYIHAAATYDQTAGTYTDDLADNTGLSSRSNTATDGALKLINASGTIASPYLSSGTAITNVIVPDMLAAWGTLSLISQTPTGTAIKAQVLDESGELYSDALLPGNSVGFTGTSIDLSALPIDQTANLTGSAKLARIVLKFTLTTTDSNFTPSINSFTLSWTKSRGDLSTSTLASTAWPLMEGSMTLRRHISGNASYEVPLWAKDQGIDFGGNVIRGTGNTLYVKTQGGIVSWPNVTNGSLSAIDRRNGATIWRRAVSGYAFTTPNITLSENSTIYMSDIFADFFGAFDAKDGTVKWFDQGYNGHGSGEVNIGPDGAIYTVRSDAGDDAFSLIARNPNGTTRWSVDENPAGQISPGQVSISGTRIYVPIAGLSGGYHNNTGALYAFNSGDGSLAWTYPTGDITQPVVDDSGIIYAANSSDFLSNKSIYALNSDGTLKWAHTISTTTDHWAGLSLRTDGVLVASRTTSVYPDTGGIVEGINTADGSVLWTLPFVSNDNEAGSEMLTDSANGLVLRALPYNSTTSLTYYDSDQQQKWTWGTSNGGDLEIQRLSGDEGGNLYATIFYFDTGTSTLVSMTPWSITPSVGGTIHAGDTITISATSSMPQLDPVSGVPNKMQAVMDDASKVALDYVSSDPDGITLWQGNYTVPSGATAGSHSFTVEASNRMMNTDIPTHFTEPSNPGNTGYSKNSSFVVSVLAAVSSGGGGGGGSAVFFPPVTMAPGSSAPAVIPPVAQPSPVAPAAPLPDRASLLARLIELIRLALGKGVPVSEDLRSLAGSPAKYLFERDLAPGARGEDVRQLQIFLNTHGFPVATSGSGAKGHETTVFGYGTQSALAAFQDAHASAILVPYGIARGNGYFGPATRGFVNSAN